MVMHSFSVMIKSLTFAILLIFLKDCMAKADIEVIYIAPGMQVTILTSNNVDATPV